MARKAFQPMRVTQRKFSNVLDPARARVLARTDEEGYVFRRQSHAPYYYDVSHSLVSELCMHAQRLISKLTAVVTKDVLAPI